MKNYMFLFALSLLIFLPTCNNSSQTGNNPEANEKKQKVSATKTADLARFRKFSYIDKQGTGSEAFSFLMPVDWVFSGRTTFRVRQCLGERQRGIRGFGRP